MKQPRRQNKHKRAVADNLGFFRFRHAGRSTVNVSDVLLLARRNEGLESILRAFIDKQRQNSENEA